MIVPVPPPVPLPVDGRTEAFNRWLFSFWSSVNAAGSLAPTIISADVFGRKAGLAGPLSGDSQVLMGGRVFNHFPHSPAILGDSQQVILNQVFGG